MDCQNTIFGSGNAGRMRVKSFFMMYMKDWEGVEGDHLEAIYEKHPGLDLWTLYESALKAKKGGKTYEMFIADYLGIDYEGVDTSSEAWNNMIMEKLDSITSPIEADIAVQFADLR